MVIVSQDLYEQLVAREQSTKAAEERLMEAKEKHERQVRQHDAQTSEMARRNELLQHEKAGALQQLKAADDRRRQLELQLQDMRSVISLHILSDSSHSGWPIPMF